jgi:hypothetical protein
MDVGVDHPGENDEAPGIYHLARGRQVSYYDNPSFRDAEVGPLASLRRDHQAAFDDEVESHVDRVLGFEPPAALAPGPANLGEGWRVGSTLADGGH